MCEVQNFGGFLKNICNPTQEWTSMVEEQSGNMMNDFRCTNTPHVSYYMFRRKEGRQVLKLAIYFVDFFPNCGAGMIIQKSIIHAIVNTISPHR